MRWQSGLTATRLLGVAVLALVCASGAASADADSIRQVTRGIVDNSPADARVTWDFQASLNGHTVTITNPQLNEGRVFAYGNGDQGVITSVDLNGAGGYSGNGGEGGNGSVANGSFNHQAPTTASGGSWSGDNCQILDYLNLVCYFAPYGAANATGGIRPGQTATIDYSTNTPGALDSVSFNFDFDDLYPRCRPGGFGDDVRDLSGPLTPVATTADNSCQPPSKVLIKTMHVNKKKHTAGFHQTAKGARGFRCNLYRNGHLMFGHSCGATKNYTNSLPGGSYRYYVWGTNSSGVSRDFAIAQFKL